VAERVRPHRADGHGESWALLAAHHDRFKTMVDDQGLTVVKAGDLLARQGIVVPERPLHRYALVVLGHGRGGGKMTVRVADCEPGAECQVDFGRMGLMDDPQAGRRPVVHALIFTAVYSRHCFVWLTFRQDLPALSPVRGCMGVLRRGLQGRNPGSLCFITVSHSMRAEAGPTSRQRPPAFSSLLLFTALETGLYLVRMSSARPARQNATWRHAASCCGSAARRETRHERYRTRRVRKE